jgi:PAS domain S-box-containing protein
MINVESIDIKDNAIMELPTWSNLSDYLAWPPLLPHQVITVLLVEDDAGDAFLFRETLAEVVSHSFRVTHAARLADALVAIARQNFDILILDMVLPDSLGIESISKIREVNNHVPIVIMSSVDDSEFAFSGVKAGAQDYLVKGAANTDVLVRTIRYSIERKRAEEAFRTSEERFRQAFDYAAIGMGLTGNDGRWLKVNRSLCELTGYSEKELLDSTFQSRLHPDDLNSHLALVQRLTADEVRFYQIENSLLHKSGRRVWVMVNVSLVRGLLGEPLHFIFQLQDITLRKEVDRALRDSTDHAQQRSDMLVAEESARRRLMMDNYAGPLQTLSNTLKTVISLEQSLKGKRRPDEQEIGELRTSLSETCTSIRALLGV